jgi:pimeloyl-ACP methyl ester carboxylesterase
MADFTITVGGTTLSGDESGQAKPATSEARPWAPVVLLHGLTATRRYVVMGSTALQRSEHRVIAYDARAHGKSDGGDDYSYARLADDLLAILDDREIDRAVFAGASMGAHTLAAFALAHPERVTGLAIITPAFDPDEDQADRFDRWDRLAEGLRSGGVEGFVQAYDFSAVPEKWRETIDRVLHQRLSAHLHPDALADALQQVPRSRPFERWEDLAAIDAPVTVVASRDEADPEHPYAIAERYAREIPGARLVSEEPGQSPLAWQGAQVSRVISQVAEAAAAAP